MVFSAGSKSGMEFTIPAIYRVSE